MHFLNEIKTGRYSVYRPVFLLKKQQSICVTKVLFAAPLFLKDEHNIIFTNA